MTLLDPEESGKTPQNIIFFYDENVLMIYFIQNLWFSLTLAQPSLSTNPSFKINIAIIYKNNLNQFSQDVEYFKFDNYGTLSVDKY